MLGLWTMAVQERCCRSGRGSRHRFVISASCRRGFRLRPFGSTMLRQPGWSLLPRRIQYLTNSPDPSTLGSFVGPLATRGEGVHTLPCFWLGYAAKARLRRFVHGTIPRSSMHTTACSDQQSSRHAWPWSCPPISPFWAPYAWANPTIPRRSLTKSSTV
jgi:hypothetical protein